MKENLQKFIKAAGQKLRKLFGYRGLWSVLGILVCLYIVIFYFLGGSSTSKFIYDYLSLSTPSVPFFLAFVIVLVLYIGRMEKDFFRGFYRVFAGKEKGISRMELQRAVKAFDCAEKTTVTAGIILFILAIMVMLNSDVMFQQPLTDLSLWVLSVSLETVSTYAIYPALFVLVLTPVKIRLERMLISYMEEPEDAEAERTEADEQRLYFGLRAMGLTDREAEVARLAGSGISNREIGQQLYITEGTVKKHMTHILEKTGCANRETLAKKLKEL